MFQIVVKSYSHTFPMGNAKMLSHYATVNSGAETYPGPHHVLVYLASQSTIHTRQEGLDEKLLGS